jgi:hypothetical protein
MDLNQLPSTSAPNSRLAASRSAYRCARDPPRFLVYAAHFSRVGVRISSHVPRIPTTEAASCMRSTLDNFARVIRVRKTQHPPALGVGIQKAG